MNKRLNVILTLMLAALLASAQPQAEQVTQEALIPQVALIGEYESLFADLAQEHPGILLSACGNDMDVAYEKWTDMIVAMEDYARSLLFDINGLKTYLYIFWNADGSFRHLAFYPKANSRNIPNEELLAFFKAFVKEYQLPLKAKEGFSHYGSASFPTHARPELKAKRD